MSQSNGRKLLLHIETVKTLNEILKDLCEYPKEKSHEVTRLHTPEDALSVAHFLIPRGILYSVFTWRKMLKYRVSENVIFVPSFQSVGAESCLEIACAHPSPCTRSSFIITGENVDFAKPFGACLGTDRVFSKLINFVVIIKMLVETEILLSLQDATVPLGQIGSAGSLSTPRQPPPR